MKRIKLTKLDRDYLASLSNCQDRVLAFWRLAMPGEWDAAESVAATAYAIPKAQWTELCPCGFENGAWLWMNYGPSVY